MARLSEYNFELCQEICEQVAEGLNIKTVLKSKENYPSFQTWCNWKRENQELFDLYVKTMQDKAESEIEEIDNVYTLLKNGEIEPSAANVLIQTKKWTAAKFYPKMFGDKVDFTTDGEKITSKSIPIVLQDGKSYQDLKDELQPE